MNEKGKLKRSIMPATDMHGNVRYQLQGQIKKAKVKKGSEQVF